MSAYAVAVAACLASTFTPAQTSNDNEDIELFLRHPAHHPATSPATRGESVSVPGLAQSGENIKQETTSFNTKDPIKQKTLMWIRHEWMKSLSSRFCSDLVLKNEKNVPNAESEQ